MKSVNRRLLKKLGYVVYLKVSPKTVIERLKSDTTRPLLQKPDKERAVRELMEERKGKYQKQAYLTVITDGKSVDEIIDEIEQDI